MLPSNPALYYAQSSTSYLRAAFQYPYNINPGTELEDYEMGGVAIQDPSKGINYQIWKCIYDEPSKQVCLIKNLDGVLIPLFAQPIVDELSFTFDQNMRWSTAIRIAETKQMFHRWYDSAAQTYVETEYDNVTSVKLCTDDHRYNQVNAGSSDMILTYIQGGTLKWRIQRDRFGTEYTYPTKQFSVTTKIANFGMSTKNRLQWRLATRHIYINNAQPKRPPISTSS